MHNNMHKLYPAPYHANIPVNTPPYPQANMYNAYKMYPCPYLLGMLMYNPGLVKQFLDQYILFNQYISNNTFTGKAGDTRPIELKDYGPDPFAVNIEAAAKQNSNFRIVLWTGSHLQLTLMSLKPGEDIGLEVHPGLDQFIRIEEGQGLVKMGDSKHNLNFQRRVYDDYAFIIPAGKWHNLINTGNRPLKLYSIYAPPQHPYGTVHETKEIAQASEKNT
ncbi:MAG: cupin domain-containing protein [Clostridiaceae bacterium]|nr:cupin domain-containing protein [Clostridiaceae bacterium]